MKHTISTQVFCIVLISFLGMSGTYVLAADNAPAPRGSESPMGNYWFTSDGRDICMLKSKSRPEYSCDVGPIDHRGGSITWSSDERFFCSLEKPDGHITVAKIYQIVTDKSTKLIDHIELVYATPQAERYDQSWSFKGWNLKKGTAALHCRYAVDGTDSIRRRWSECDVEILIDYCDRGGGPANTFKKGEPGADGKPPKAAQPPR